MREQHAGSYYVVCVQLPNDILWQWRKKLRKLNTMSAYDRQKAKSKYRNRIRLERSSQKQSNDIHKIPYDRVKRCRELVTIVSIAIGDNICVVSGGNFEWALRNTSSSQPGARISFIFPRTGRPFTSLAVENRDANLVIFPPDLNSLDYDPRSLGVTRGASNLPDDQGERYRSVTGLRVDNVGVCADKMDERIFLIISVVCDVWRRLVFGAAWWYIDALADVEKCLARTMIRAHSPANIRDLSVEVSVTIRAHPPANIGDLSVEVSVTIRAHPPANIGRPFTSKYRDLNVEVSVTIRAHPPANIGDLSVEVSVTIRAIHQQISGAHPPAISGAHPPANIGDLSVEVSVTIRAHPPENIGRPSTSKYRAPIHQQISGISMLRCRLPFAPIHQQVSGISSVEVSVTIRAHPPANIGDLSVEVSVTIRAHPPANIGDLSVEVSVTIRAHPPANIGRPSTSKISGISMLRCRLPFARGYNVHVRGSGFDGMWIGSSKLPPIRDKNNRFPAGLSPCLLHRSGTDDSDHHLDLDDLHLYLTSVTLTTCV
ncbi:hypothetical protein PR048_024171 [Dryococelus australis]|uniref:Uncharacterized protein n=1 Tax=Dryococelus australis TaxID=614101 RepID=A0ABQ9GW85_9NEOP|nr:hypothetical protein PR048_024171 [Dryococelus australis]